MERTEWYPILWKKYPDFVTFSEIEHTFHRMLEIFHEHERILISVSGGSDSDCIVHLVCAYFPEYIDKCHFVFVDTGLEYDATKRHLCDIEKRYGVEIKRLRGVSVVTAVAKHGFPILSKSKSHNIDLYLRGLPSGERSVFGDAAKHWSLRFTEKQKELVRYLERNHIKVSAKCCDISKKNPLFKYIKENNIDLDVTGERQAEGGQRALIHKSCFEPGNHGIDKYMPLWFWSDKTKADFKRIEGILYSDCYEVYGMKRTGCCGCPFNLNIADELAIMAQYEPMLYKACMRVFGQSYELMDRFNVRRKKCIPEVIQFQLRFDDGGDMD